MGELRQRGRIWWLRYYRDGRRFEESSGTDKYKKAKGILKERRGTPQRASPTRRRWAGYASTKR